MTVLLEAQGLSIGHAGRVVAREITLRLPAGRILCLLGPNGGGKTTLLRTMLGLIPPIAGTVRVGGADIRQLPRREVARCLAYVPQAATGGFGYAARDVVVMGRAARLPLLAAPGRADLAAAEAALGRLGIGHLADVPVTELSGGERQLVLVARALAQDSTVLVMDEPTASLDFGNQALVLRQVATLAQQEGLAILMTTHQPDHALLVAHEVMLLHGGAAVGPDRPETLITPERLFDAFRVDVIVRDVEAMGIRRRICVPVVRRPAEP